MILEQRSWNAKLSAGSGRSLRAGYRTDEMSKATMPSTYAVDPSMDGSPASRRDT
ncbi:protein of unassigned function [Methylobacterium oryzae CBMB20]|uniref:Protein of unassigned function n=1 Tax=Methylobacterium oryzae CBMB20 TaxID=693986 RepID=A0A089QEW5_9HYPH|nr:protein of unassigned function [Methylobacterium oryzae CBMB20]